jgi:hypothetical protein
VDGCIGCSGPLGGAPGDGESKSVTRGDREVFLRLNQFGKPEIIGGG